MLPPTLPSRFLLPVAPDLWRQMPLDEYGCLPHEMPPPIPPADSPRPARLAPAPGRGRASPGPRPPRPGPPSLSRADSGCSSQHSRRTVHSPYTFEGPRELTVEEAIHNEMLLMDNYSFSHTSDVSCGSSRASSRAASASPVPSRDTSLAGPTMSQILRSAGIGGPGHSGASDAGSPSSHVVSHGPTIQEGTHPPHPALSPRWASPPPAATPELRRGATPPDRGAPARSPRPPGRRRQPGLAPTSLEQRCGSFHSPVLCSPRLQHVLAEAGHGGRRGSPSPSTPRAGPAGSPPPGLRRSGGGSASLPGFSPAAMSHQPYGHIHLHPPEPLRPPPPPPPSASRRSGANNASAGAHDLRGLTATPAAVPAPLAMCRSPGLPPGDTPLSPETAVPPSRPPRRSTSAPTSSARSSDLGLAPPAYKDATFPRSATKLPHDRPDGSDRLACNHPKPWHKLRAKRGFKFFLCPQCGERWRVACSGRLGSAEQSAE